MQNVLIVGESGTRGRELAPSSRSGRRLALLLGVDDVREVADTTNVFDEPRYFFPMHEARQIVAAWTIEHDETILLGKRVAAAFGLRRCEWFTPYLCIADPFEGNRCPAWLSAEHNNYSLTRAWVVPHPSGLNRWWNDPRNTEHAAHFLRKTIDEALHTRRRR